MPPTNAEIIIVLSTFLSVTSLNLFQIFPSCSSSKSSNVSAFSSSTTKVELVVDVAVAVVVVEVVGEDVVVGSAEVVASASVDGHSSSKVLKVMNPSYVILPRSTRPCKPRSTFYSSNFHVS